ncbi:MAG: GNAT family N-acetyltransferase, partial [Pseudomonadota bacterium]
MKPDAKTGFATTWKVQHPDVAVRPRGAPIAQSGLNLKATGPIELSVYRDVASLRHEWNDIVSRAPASLYQSFDWVETWSRQAGRGAKMQPRIVVGRKDGKVLFLLPLSTYRRAFYRMLSFLADTHSNFCMGLFDRDLIPRLTKADMQALIAELAELLAPVDVLEFCCQPVGWDDTTNPFALLRWQQSHNMGYALSLEGGFDAALNRRNGARKRKKFRWQTNKLKSVGGAHLRIASTPQEVDSFMDRAMELTSKRFDRAGIWNTFQNEGVVPFFRELATSSLGQDEPALLLYGLEIEGKLRAVFAGGIRSGQFHGCFTAIADDEYTSVSPGEMLIYLVIQDCVGRGLHTFDLGRGEERYKTSWCDQRLAMFETSIALKRTAIGYTTYENVKLSIKRVMRS